MSSQKKPPTLGRSWTTSNTVMSLELFPDIVPRKKPITPKMIGTRDSVFLGGGAARKKKNPILFTTLTILPWEQGLVFTKVDPICMKLFWHRIIIFNIFLFLAWGLTVLVRGHSKTTYPLVWFRPPRIRSFWSWKIILFLGKQWILLKQNVILNLQTLQNGCKVLSCCEGLF